MLHGWPACNGVVNAGRASWEWQPSMQLAPGWRGRRWRRAGAAKQAEQWVVVWLAVPDVGRQQRWVGESKCCYDLPPLAGGQHSHSTAQHGTAQHTWVAAARAKAEVGWGCAASRAVKCRTVGRQRRRVEAYSCRYDLPPLVGGRHSHSTAQYSTAARTWVAAAKAKAEAGWGSEAAAKGCRAGRAGQQRTVAQDGSTG